MSDSRRAVLRHAEWTLSPEHDDHGAARVPVREIQCRTCGRRSGPRQGQEHTEPWPLRHAGITHHRDHLEIAAATLTAHPAPTNPLYEQERPPS